VADVLVYCTFSTRSDSSDDAFLLIESTHQPSILYIIIWTAFTTGRLKAIKDHIDLVATVAEVSAEAEDVKARKKQRKEKDTAEREQKKAASAEKEARKMEEILPLLNSDVNKFTNRGKEIERAELIREIEKELKLPYLKEIFMYYYGMKKGEVNGEKKADLVTLLVDKVTAEDNDITE